MHSTILGRWLLCFLLAGAPIPGTAGPDSDWEHGGGCRKSSPPGQCCHMDNRSGTVHCH